ncbi:MAG: HAMP domain-containing sensor histidine kinase [Actinomycetota bacterium]
MGDQQLRDLDIVAVTSHEMRSPLAAIRGFVDTLRRRRHSMDDDQVEEFLTVIASQADRLTRLVDDLLVLAGLDAGGIKVAVEPVLLVPFLESVLAEQPVGEGRVALSVSAEAPATIETDPLRLHQIVANLLANALKYSSQDQPIALTVGSESDRLVLEVSDRGPGIPLLELDRIFEPYYRTAEGRAAADGFGLGLSITRRLAEALGGQLTVTSVVGEGSSFRLSLPATPARVPRS